MSEILNVAAKSATYNIVFQVLMRIVTFVLNAFVLRYISQDVLGVINVRLLLLYSTIQFLSRESFRRACLSKVKNQNMNQMINVLWLVIPISAVCGSILGYFWLNILVAPSIEITTEYRIGVVSVVLAAIIESIAEPVFVVMQTMLFVRLRVFIEGTMLLIRAMLMTYFVQRYPHSGVWDFSCALLISSSVYTFIYYAYFSYYTLSKRDHEFKFRNVSEIFPSKQHDQTLFDQRVVGLVKSFFKQGLLKQLLTEGERYVMTIFGILTFAEQGVYDVVNNLGSLAARFIFAPVEESAYLFFTQTISRGTSLSNDDSKDSSNTAFAASVLESLLKLMCLFGITVMVFGYWFSPLLLQIYGGPKLSTGLGPTLLRFHCVYVVLLAVNGVTEAFVFASMSQKQVDKYNHKMILFTIMFIVLSLLFTRWLGSVGFILANCCNMMLRIAHSLYFINVFYKATVLQPLVGLKPSIVVMASYLISFCILYITKETLAIEYTIKSSAIFIGVGIACLAFTFVSIIVSEKTLVNFIYYQWKKKKVKPE